VAPPARLHKVNPVITERRLPSPTADGPEFAVPTPQAACEASNPGQLAEPTAGRRRRNDVFWHRPDYDLFLYQKFIYSTYINSNFML